MSRVTCPFTRAGTTVATPNHAHPTFNYRSRDRRACIQPRLPSRIKRYNTKLRNLETSDILAVLAFPGSCKSSHGAFRPCILALTSGFRVAGLASVGMWKNDIWMKEEFHRDYMKLPDLGLMTWGLGAWVLLGSLHRS